MSRTSTLWHLQTIDQEIYEKTKRAQQVGEAQANNPKVVAAKTALEADQKNLAQARAALRDRELDASSLEAKIKQLDTQLSRTPSPKFRSTALPPRATSG